MATSAQRWFVSFTVEVDRAVPERHARPGSVIGVDLGVKTLLTGAGRVPVNQEPGTANEGETGTAARQQAAAA